MTWVIGMPGFLTRGVLVGDVRITLVDAETGRPVREFEGVRKIYPVAANMAMGFAGNIDAGLRMVGDLAWNVRNAVPEGHALEQPSRFLFHWRRRARWSWRERMDACEKAGAARCSSSVHFLRPAHSCPPSATSCTRPISSLSRFRHGRRPPSAAVRT
jgi:hypothetical protein